MSHLGISQVALAAHSAGTIYLLNTLIHLPHVLSPRRPYVAIVGE